MCSDVPRLSSKSVRWKSCGLVEDALDFSPVDVEFSGNGTLTLARLVPCTNRLLQAWRSRQFQWCFLRQRWCRLVTRFGFSGTCAATTFGTNQHHEQFE